jgi:hypothetical protein
MKTNMDQRQKNIHLDAKIKEDLNKNQGEKWKLNAVAEKENTRWMIRVKKQSVQPFIAANKTKENWKLKQRRSKKNA